MKLLRFPHLRSRTQVGRTILITCLLRYAKIAVTLNVSVDFIVLHTFDSQQATLWRTCLSSIHNSLSFFINIDRSFDSLSNVVVCNSNIYWRWILARNETIAPVQHWISRWTTNRKPASSMAQILDRLLSSLKLILINITFNCSSLFGLISTWFLIYFNWITREFFARS